MNRLKRSIARTLACMSPAFVAGTLMVAPIAHADRGALADGPRSQLANIALPMGSTGRGDYASKIKGEYWNVPTAYRSTVDYLRQQLPVGRRYGSMAWCAEDVLTPLTQWVWGDETEMLVVGVHRDSGEVYVSRGPDHVGC